MHSTPAAALLLCSHGTGRAAALCLHAIAVGVCLPAGHCCFPSLFFVHQLVPLSSVGREAEPGSTR